MKSFFRYLSYAAVLVSVVFLPPLCESLRIENIDFEENEKNYLNIESTTQDILGSADEQLTIDNTSDTDNIIDENENVGVKKVIDGDTIVLEDNRTARLIGINTPEKYQKFGREATIKTKELVEGKEVMLEYDRGRYDKYGRVLAYVYVEDIFINYELLRQGFANLMIISPNNKYINEFKKAKEEAKAERLGIWKGE